MKTYQSERDPWIERNTQGGINDSRDIRTYTDSQIRF